MAPTILPLYIFLHKAVLAVLFYMFQDDAAANWYALSDTTGNDKDWLGGQGWYDNTIAVNPYDKNSVYVGGVGFLD